MAKSSLQNRLYYLKKTGQIEAYNELIIERDRVKNERYINMYKHTKQTAGSAKSEFEPIIKPIKTPNIIKPITTANIKPPTHENIKPITTPDIIQAIKTPNIIQAIKTPDIIQAIKTPIIKPIKTPDIIQAITTPIKTPYIIQAIKTPIKTPDIIQAIKTPEHASKIITKSKPVFISVKMPYENIDTLNVKSTDPQKNINYAFKNQISKLSNSLTNTPIYNDYNDYNDIYNNEDSPPMSFIEEPPTQTDQPNSIQTDQPNSIQENKFIEKINKFTIQEARDALFNLIKQRDYVDASKILKLLKIRITKNKYDILKKIYKHSLKKHIERLNT